MEKLGVLMNGVDPVALRLMMLVPELLEIVPAVTVPRLADNADNEPNEATLI